MSRPRWTEFDAVLFACMLALMGVGAVFLWSVSERPDLLAPDYRGTLGRQLSWALLGLLGHFTVLRVPMRVWRLQAPGVYVLSLATLLGVLLFGTRVNQAIRWFSVGGGITVQPSEFVKPLLVLPLAGLLAYRSGGGWGVLARAAALVAPPMLLVMLQPDMGTALLFLPMTLGMLFVAGVRFRLLAGILLFTFLLGGAFLTVGLEGYRARAASLDAQERLWGLHPYQWRRIESFLEPGRHRSAGSFQAEQARIAIGSGRILGKGIRNGTQSQLKILPVRRSDFIFAVVGEEWGLMGGLVVVLAYAGILVGCFAAANRALDPFGRLVAAGVGLLIGSEALLNLGVVTGLLPVTGTPLPLVSQGGSSMIATCMALGLVQSVRMRPGLDL